VTLVRPSMSEAQSPRCRSRWDKTSCSCRTRRNVRRRRPNAIVELMLESLVDAGDRSGSPIWVRTASTLSTAARFSRGFGRRVGQVGHDCGPGRRTGLDDETLVNLVRRMS